MTAKRFLTIGVLVVGSTSGLTAQDTRVTKATPDRPDALQTASNRDNDTTKLFRLLGRNAIWTPVKTIAVDWPTFHTQGLVKIGDTFYVSSVEVLTNRVSTGVATDALYDFSIDRSPGTGRAWLFKFDSSGHLLGSVELTDGTKYHPGGIDFDGHTSGFRSPNTGPTAPATSIVSTRPRSPRNSCSRKTITSAGSYTISAAERFTA